jgi:hypothetical protein
MLPFIALVQSPAPSASISGTVIDEAGRPVPAARISYNKHTEHEPDSRWRPRIKELGFAATITSGPDGRFTITGLPGGTYGVCALASGATQLGSCEWDPVPSINLGPSQAAESITRIVHDGTLLTIRVADPSSRIVLPDSRGNVAQRGRRFFIGVSSDTGF